MPGGVAVANALRRAMWGRPSLGGPVKSRPATRQHWVPPQSADRPITRTVEYGVLHPLRQQKSEREGTRFGLCGHWLTWPEPTQAPPTGEIPANSGPDESREEAIH